MNPWPYQSESVCPEELPLVKKLYVTIIQEDSVLDIIRSWWQNIIKDSGMKSVECRRYVTISQEVFVKDSSGSWWWILIEYVRGKSTERHRDVTFSQYSCRVSEKKFYEKTSYIDEKIGVGRGTRDGGHFSPIGSLMCGEDCNQCWMTKKLEETVTCFFYLVENWDL